jgi:hypothetical protein
VNKLERRANCVILAYPDARQKASCSKGEIAIYFIGGNLNGQRWVFPPVSLGRTLVINDEQYKLHVLRESISPKFMYPFYVNKRTP